MNQLHKYIKNLIIFRDKKIPVEWKEATMTILHKNGDEGDIKTYRHIGLLSHKYKLFTRILQKEWRRFWTENQPREQTGFRKGYLTIDHLQTINKLIEKYNEFKRPLWIGYIDHEKAFYSLEHEVIFRH